MKDLSRFGKFSKSAIPATSKGAKAAVVYTRVSSKEQADTNLSLDFQKKAIEEYAQRNGFTVVAYFGGTYESAKTDGRKEFGRMQDFIRKNKGKVSHILVYTLDRFSRTGGGAIKLADELREKYGVMVFAVTQPTDTSNASGQLQQNMYLLFSQYENTLRRQRAMAGMKEKFSRGIWAAKPPMGYDTIRTNGERKIVVNDTGKLLRKAFIWKTEGVKNEEILVKLRARGVRIYKQQLTKVLKNPFYCGWVSHGLLEGEVVEGSHEKLISEATFLKVNKINQESAGYGVPHKKENDQVPLKIFVRCGTCDAPFTGYIVKAKELWYYKCRTTGCKSNKSATSMHQLFEALLGKYALLPHLLAPLMQLLKARLKEGKKGQQDEVEVYRARLKEVTRKLDRLETKYYVNEEMNRQTFEKLYVPLKAEQSDITDEWAKLDTGDSDLRCLKELVLPFAADLSALWSTCEVKEKERLQALMFPDGITYNKEKVMLQTNAINQIFRLNAGEKKESVAVDDNSYLHAA